MKLQKEPYYCSQNINKLTPKAILENNWNEKVIYFLIANIQKFVSLYNGQQGGYKLEDIKNHIIELPIKNGNIDFDFMEKIVSAIQKIVIKDVVLYTDKKIKITKNLINKNNHAE